MKTIFLRAAAVLGCALLVPAPPAGAQGSAEPQAPPSIFGEQIEVRVVNVEAVVTDRKGDRVSGLKPQDFRLLVDGKEVPIEYFTEIRGGQAVEGISQDAPVQGLPGLTAGSPVGTSYLVFIDDLFSVAPRRNEVLRKLEERLTQLGPEDRVAIVAYDGRKLEMLSTWSNSDRDLRRALSNAMARKAYGLERLSELRQFETSRRLGINQGVGPRAAFRDRLDTDERGYTARLVQQIRRVVSATVSSLRGFASPPGRKVMIVLSGGWPADPAQYVVDDPNRQVFEGEIPRSAELYRPIVDTANRLGYTLYTVDVPGLETEAIDTNTGRGPFGTLDNSVFREQEVHHTLEVVAKATGGRALINSARVDAFDVAASDTRSYYWLGFTPQWQGNDQRHVVKVELRLPDLTVRSRDNYLDLSRRAESTMMVESAMLFGAAPGAATLPIKLGEPVLTGRREMEVPYSVAIPVESFTAVPIDGKYVAELELRIAAIDEDGDTSGTPTVPIRLSFPQPPPAGKFVPYGGKLRLRQTGHHLVLAVYDPASQTILTGEAEVSPPSKKAKNRK